MKKQELVNKFLTKEGKKSLTNRMTSFIGFFDKGIFPTGDLMMLGFGKFNIESKEECLFRIKELGEILGISWKIEKTEVKLSDGTIKKKEEIKWQ